MALRKLAKDRDSGKHGCPTVYADEDVRVEGDQVLVLQGDVVVDVAATTGAEVDPAATRCVWSPEGTVLALGVRLPAEREQELENRLPGEAAVALLAGELFGQPRFGSAEDLGAPGPGQALLRIKAETVRDARDRYHGSSA